MAQYHATSLYVTSRWAAKPTSPWAGEMALSGHRIGIVAVPDSVPGTDTGEKTLVDFLINDASVSATTTHFSKAQNWAGDGSTSANITDGDQDGIVEALWTYWDTMKAYLSPEFTLQDIRLYAIAATGRMAGNSPCIYTPTAALAGTGASSAPPQLAFVVSTRSAVNSRRGRGRFYLGPVSAGQITPTGLAGSGFTSTTSAGLKAVKDLYNAWRGLGGVTSTGYYPMVHSPGSASGFVIRDVRAGDEFDTQQRRRRQRREQYASLSL